VPELLLQAAMWQGPHHSAQKSTSTGTRASRVISSKADASTSMGSADGDRVALQEPQRPVSDRCLADTRFFVPQAGQVLMTEKLTAVF
jgi:hypothetical protein